METRAQFDEFNVLVGNVKQNLESAHNNAITMYNGAYEYRKVAELKMEVGQDKFEAARQERLQTKNLNTRIENRVANQPADFIDNQLRMRDNNLHERMKAVLDERLQIQDQNLLEKLEVRNQNLLEALEARDQNLFQRLNTMLDDKTQGALANNKRSHPESSSPPPELNPDKPHHQD